MMRALILGLTFFSLLIFIGCGTSSPTVASIGNDKMTLNEFEDSYAKNNGSWDAGVKASLDERQKYLDLLIKFKLKVKEARDKGLERDSALLSELATYRVSVAQSYMLEKEIVEPGIKQMYDRTKEEVRVSQIFFRVSPKASPSDTLKAYKRAVKAIEQIAVKPFDSLAIEMSDDPQAKINGGDLGYETGGKTVPEFEDACYSMKPGEYTKIPVRSSYGYHVIKVTERQPYPGSIRLSHILLRFNRSLSDTTAVKDTIWMIYRQLKSGTNFNDMVKKYSQDPQGKLNDGDLGVYEHERIPPTISNLLFSLAIDSITEPQRFNYGYHIFKVTEKKPLPTFSEIKNELKEKYQRLRYQYEYRKYIDALKTKYRLSIDTADVVRVAQVLDTTKTPAYDDWISPLTAELLGTPLITTTQRTFTTKDFVEKVINTTEFNSNFLTQTNVWSIINRCVDDVVLEQPALQASERYPELVKLMKEYEEGILLYRIEQDEVWKKVTINDSLLRIYYEENKEKYRWPERVNFAEIYVLSDSLAKAAYWKLRYGEDFLDVAEEYTVRTGYKEKKGVWGFQPFTFNELSTKASKMALDSIAPPFKQRAGWSIIKTLGFDSAHVKTFEEASPEVASAYQEIRSKQIEQEWIEALKLKYPVVINKEILTEAFKRERIESQ